MAEESVLVKIKSRIMLDTLRQVLMLILLFCLGFFSFASKHLMRNGFFFVFAIAGDLLTSFKFLSGFCKKFSGIS